MITTIEIKEHRDDVFEIGSGPVNILILGSCRTVAYVNYFDRYNKTYSHPFTDPFNIFVIEPNNYHFGDNDQPMDLDVELRKQETNERILQIIRNTDFFIHEHYAHFGMFNTDRNATKNIYQFGMRPNHDIAIPNFHDHFILEHDYTACGIPTPDDYIKKGELEVEKFCNVCIKSSFPEFGEIFRQNWRELRYFWRPNHVSALFTLDIFGMMNSKFLNLPLSEEFWNGARTEDLFKEPHTEVTDRDREGYGLKWS